jgi:hypothetical protein
MLPHPDLVNREDGTYLVEGPGHGGIKVSVTSENWDTLRFNTKSMNPEYFPSSYLNHVPSPFPTELANKDSSKKGVIAGPSFPRSTITGTLEDFRILLRCSVLSKSNKIPAETYRALSLDLSSEALDVTDKATAPKRISTFLNEVVCPSRASTRSTTKRLKSSTLRLLTTSQTQSLPLKIFR